MFYLQFKNIHVYWTSFRKLSTVLCGVFYRFWLSKEILLNLQKLANKDFAQKFYFLYSEGDYLFIYESQYASKVEI